ncbi:MAG TPA: M13 family metallopeptidase [Candidatus Acidoferrales bacterium]|nr:M13 family metallopeptidase [Candidatus Acidoferrales bacterium]
MNLTVASPQSVAPATASGDILASNLDISSNPGTDFFSYANGGWLGRHPIPIEEAGWGIGNLVEEELYLKLRKINETAAATRAPAGSDQQKIGDFWRTAMDEALADESGLAPLQPELELIDSIQTVGDVIRVSFALRPVGVDTFFDVSVGQDERQSDLMSVHVEQDGLGLPERDFYFNPEKGTALIRKEYVAHLSRMLKLMGRPETDAQLAAGQVMKFETALARASRKLEDLRDPERNYHKMSPARLRDKHTPLIAWQEYLGAMSLQPEFVIVGQPEFFTALNRLLDRTPVPVLKDYLRLHLLSAYAEYLGKAWDEEDFSFAGKVLGGQQQDRPRWKRVLDSQEHAMGMVLGKIFVQDYFPERTKQRYRGLVAAILTAYRERIDRLDWMSDATKDRAREKLAKIKAKVGYPDHWKDYSTLLVGTNSYCENMKKAARWHFDDMISRFGKPVDRTEWDMTPQTYNAYYDDANNEIVLPAAIFTVPGTRDDELDDALVYGYAAASTIGHEVTHGFDDEGRRFDAAGNLNDWWTARDAARFKKRAAALVAQFNAYEPLPGLHINGQASLGENLADYGGVLLGLDAFKKTAQYRDGLKISGLTPLQRYFLGYALSWASHERVAHLREELLSDVHAPAKWRVNGPLSNIPDFYLAFGIKPGQPMWRPPEQRVKVW